MKKTFLIAGVISFFIFSCTKKSYDKKELALALLNHSYYDLSREKVDELVKSGEKEIAKIDSRFQIVYLKGKRVKKKQENKEEKIFYYPFILKANGKRYLIAKVFDYTIAYDAGLKNGILNFINDGLPDLDPCTLNEHISKTSFLKLSFNDGKADWSIILKKEMNAFPFVWSMMLSDDTAYINVVSLTTNSSTFFKNNVTNLIRRGARKLIIDLRDVSYGNYEEVANIISFFSKSSKNYFIKSSKRGYSISFDVKENIFKDMKVAVIVDRKTSLLGEVMAQSLREWGAYIVGEKTAGNVYITKMFKVANDAAAQLTVAKIYPPSGKDMDDGITPDLNVTYLNYKKYGISYVIDCDLAVMKAFELISGLKPV